MIITEQKNSWLLQCDTNTENFEAIKSKLTISRMSRTPVGNFAESRPLYHQMDANTLMIPYGLVYRFLMHYGDTSNIRIRKLQDEYPLPIERITNQIELKDYQWEGIQPVRFHRKGVFQLATSGGKSYMIAVLAEAFRRLGLRVVISMPGNASFDSIMQKLPLAVPAECIGGINDYDKPIIVGLYQSLHNRLDKYGKIDVHLIDEVHAATAPGYRDFIKEMDAYRLYGFSYTAISQKSVSKPIQGLDDYELNLISLCGDILYYRHTSEFKETEILPLLYYQVYNQFPCNGNNWTMIRKRILESRLIIQLTSQICQFLNQTPSNTMILVPTKSLGRRLHDVLLQVGVPCALYYGGGYCEFGKQKVTVEEMYEGFGSKFKFIIGTSHLQQSLDRKDINNFIDMIGGKKEKWLLQRAGRIVRPGPNKEYGLYIDFYNAGNGVTKFHSEERMAIARTATRVAKVVTLANLKTVIEALYHEHQ